MNDCVACLSHAPHRITSNVRLRVFKFHCAKITSDGRRQRRRIIATRVRSGSGSGASTWNGVEARRLGVVVVASVVVVVVVAEVQIHRSMTDERLDATVGGQLSWSSDGNATDWHDEAQTKTPAQRPADNVEREHGRQCNDDDVPRRDDDVSSSVDDRQKRVGNMLLITVHFEP